VRFLYAMVRPEKIMHAIVQKDGAAPHGLSWPHPSADTQSSRAPAAQTRQQKHSKNGIGDANRFDANRDDADAHRYMII